MGQNYLRSLLALGFQAFLIIVCVAIDAVLVQNIALEDDIIMAIWSCVGYTVLLLSLIHILTSPYTSQTGRTAAYQTHTSMCFAPSVPLSRTVNGTGWTPPTGETPLIKNSHG